MPQMKVIDDDTGMSIAIHFQSEPTSGTFEFLGDLLHWRGINKKVAEQLKAPKLPMPEHLVQGPPLTPKEPK